MTWLKQALQKVLIIARGTSGSGKSSLVRNLKQELGAVVFSSDDYFMRNGVYNFDPTQLTNAHNWNHDRVEDAMAREVPVIIVDNTNSKLWEMKNYVLMAQNHGYAVDFKEPNWHPDLRDEQGRWNVDFLESMQQNPDREKKVPRAILEKMVAGYEYNPTIEDILRSERPSLQGIGVKSAKSTL